MERRKRVKERINNFCRPQHSHALTHQESETANRERGGEREERETNRKRERRC
jgi:hypothetical protein